MTASRFVLARLERRLVGRVEQLEQRLDAGEDVWHELIEAAQALAAFASATAPGAGGELLTTAQLAERLQVSVRTVRRRVKTGELKPIRLGERGRGALRWAAR